MTSDETPEVHGGTRTVDVEQATDARSGEETKTTSFADGAGETGERDDVPDKESDEIDDLPGVVEDFLHHLTAEKGRSRSTERAYRHELRRYVAGLDGRVESATASDVRAHLDGLRRSGFSRSTAKRAKASIRGLHRFLHDSGLSDFDPTVEVTESLEDALPLSPPPLAEIVDRLESAGANPQQGEVSGSPDSSEAAHPGDDSIVDADVADAAGLGSRDPEIDIDVATREDGIPSGNDESGAYSARNVEPVELVASHQFGAVARRNIPQPDDPNVLSVLTPEVPRAAAPESAWRLVEALPGLVRRHPVTLAVVFLAPILIASAWVALRPATYVAAARVVVDPISDAEDLRALPLIHRFGEPTRTVQTAAAVIESREIAGVAAENLGGTWTADEVLENIAIVPVGQSNVLELRGTSGDETSAVELANAYTDAVFEVRNAALLSVVSVELQELEARLAVEENAAVRIGIEELMSDLRLLRSDPTLQLTEMASVAEPYGQRSAAITLAVSIVVGALLFAMASLVLDRLRPIMVDSIAEIEREVGRPVLAEVPGRIGRFARSARRNDIVPTRDSSFRLLRYKLQDELERRSPVIVTSVDSSEDSAFVALNLALELAASATPVVVVGSDPAIAWAHVSSQIAERPTIDENLLILDAAQPVGPGSSRRDQVGLLVDVAGGSRRVVVSTPPVSCDDVGIRMSQLGSLLLVIRRSETALDDVRTSAGLLRFGRAAIAGVVVIDPRRRSRRLR